MSRVVVRRAASLSAGTAGSAGRMSEREEGSRVAEVLARQDRVDVWALPWFYLAIIGTGYFFTFYDIADIGFARVGGI